MKNRLCLSVVLFFLVGSMSGLILPLTGEVFAAEPVTLKVFDPTGAIEVSQLFAARLADLNGKTVCEVYDDVWEGYRTFPLIRELITKQFPTAKIIPYNQFPVGTGNIDTPKLGDILKAKGCQAAIIGNAG
jgi:hypothetical protein